MLELTRDKYIEIENTDNVLHIGADGVLEVVTGLVVWMNAIDPPDTEKTWHFLSTFKEILLTTVKLSRRNVFTLKELESAYRNLNTLVEMTKFYNEEYNEN